MWQISMLLQAATAVWCHYCQLTSCPATNLPTAGDLGRQNCCCGGHAERRSHSRSKATPALEQPSQHPSAPKVGCSALSYPPVLPLGGVFNSALAYQLAAPIKWCLLSSALAYQPAVVARWWCVLCAIDHVLFMLALADGQATQGTRQVEQIVSLA
jgi:hypothetical protein